MQYKYQTVRINVPAAAAAGRDTFKVETDTTYRRIIGLYIPEQDSFAPPLRLGLRDASGSYQDLTSIRDYVVNTAVPPRDRFKLLDIPAAGNTVEIPVEWYAPLAANVPFDLVFLLER